MDLILCVNINEKEKNVKRSDQFKQMIENCRFFVGVEIPRKLSKNNFIFLIVKIEDCSQKMFLWSNRLLFCGISL